MSAIDDYLSRYGESHQNRTNKLIHWICVPAISFSLVGLLFAIPFPGGRGLFTNWACLFLCGCLLYYLRLSVAMFVGFVFLAVGTLLGNYLLFEHSGLSLRDCVIVMVAIFVVSWAGQFVGHRLEGKRPSFFEDLQFLLIGPAWLLHFIYKKVGVRY